MITHILNWDRKLFLLLNNLGSEKYDNFWLFLSKESYWIPSYFILFCIIYYKLSLRNFIIFTVLLTLFIITSDQLSNLVKYRTVRIRPCINEELKGLFRLVIKYCRGKYCFYSAHASNCMLLGKVLFYLFRSYHFLKYGFIIWAILIGYSRTYLGVHFPIDILVGWSIGFLLSYLMIKSLKKLSINPIVK